MLDYHSTIGDYYQQTQITCQSMRRGIQTNKKLWLQAKIPPICNLSPVAVYLLIMSIFVLAFTFHVNIQAGTPERPISQKNDYITLARSEQKTFQKSFAPG